jgi:hypothetical protein
MGHVYWAIWAVLVAWNLKIFTNISYDEGVLVSETAIILHIQSDVNLRWTSGSRNYLGSGIFHLNTHVVAPIPNYVYDHYSCPPYFIGFAKDRCTSKLVLDSLINSIP